MFKSFVFGIVGALAFAVGANAQSLAIGAGQSQVLSGNAIGAQAAGGSLAAVAGITIGGSSANAAAVGAAGANNTTHGTSNTSTGFNVGAVHVDQTSFGAALGLAGTTNQSGAAALGSNIGQANGGYLGISLAP